MVLTLDGKSKLVRDLNEIDMAPEETEDIKADDRGTFSSTYQVNLDSMTTDTGFRFEIPQVFYIVEKTWILFLMGPSENGLQ